jgi:hypothetical protein
MNSRNGWLRGPRSVVPLLAAVLATALVVAAGLWWLSTPGPAAVHLQGEPMTDAQAAEQVLGSARQIVGVAALRDATGGYAFTSCESENKPPHQVVLYMNFRLPQSNSVKYLEGVATTMAAHGWAPSPTLGEHFGQKLTKDGVTAIFHRSEDDPNVATMRLYGECRITANHSNDNPVWTEVTDQLG